MKVVIIGAVAAGLTAAYGLKKNMKDVDITIIEKHKDISYGACGFPYYIEGLIEDSDDLVAKNRDEVIGDGIDLRILNEAVGVDFQKKIVHTLDLINEKAYDIPYDKLIIAVGGKSIRLKALEGIQGIYPLNNMEDAKAIREYLDEKLPKKAMIIGGGNKGIELLESLTRRGIDTCVIELKDRILSYYDADLADMLYQKLKGEGHKINLNENIISGIIDDNTGRIKSIVTDKGVYDVDFVLESIGIKPNTGFLEGTELLMENGAIVTDKYGRTNIEDVYSGGDCALIYNHIEKRNRYVPLGTNANKIGKLIALSIAGIAPEWKGIQGGALMKSLGYELAINGINDETARALGLEFDSMLVRTRNKSHYYPKNAELFIKLTYLKKDGKLIGAQIFGKEGSGLRIQGLAVAIYAGLTVHDLEYLDFGYIPPLNSVWDSINVAANKIVAKMKREVKS
ncbi:MAG: FAD-dependent oxidoreductase [Clostridiaceae bacterium]